MKFTHVSPGTLHFGCGTLDVLKTAELPGKSALLLTSSGTSAERIGALQRVKESLTERGILFVHAPIVEPNPLSTTVEKGADIAREHNCDFIVALGGGSTMDCAKAIAILLANGGRIWDYVQSGRGGRQPIEKAPYPIVAITTTAGTGSEVDAGGVITNPETREKVGIGHPGCIPVLAVVDPELMLSVPPKLTAYQGFDALFHAVEGYLGKKATYMSDMYALEAVRHIAKGLARAVKDGNDVEAREHVALANTLSGYVMTCTRLTSQHAMEHALSAFHHDLPHGAGLIMLSMSYFGHMIKTGARSERFVELAKAMGMRDAFRPEDFLKALFDLQVACGVSDLAMSEYGITREELPAMTENARTVGAAAFGFDPVALTFEDTLAIFEAAYR